MINFLIPINTINIEEIITEHIRKCDERGGFIQRKFVETTQYPIGSFDEKYCLANPQKHSEII